MRGSACAAVLRRQNAAAATPRMRGRRRKSQAALAWRTDMNGLGNVMRRGTGSFKPTRIAASPAARLDHFEHLAAICSARLMQKRRDGGTEGGVLVGRERGDLATGGEDGGAR